VMTVGIAVVGDRNDALPGHRELNAVMPMLGADVHAEWVPTDGPGVSNLSGFDGVWLVPGSPYADDAAAYEAIRWARAHDVPFLGTCGGLQYAVIESFRNVLEVQDASHAESDGVHDSNVIAALAGKPVHLLLHEFVGRARESAGQAAAGEASSSASS